MSEGGKSSGRLASVCGRAFPVKTKSQHYLCIPYAHCYIWFPFVFLATFLLYDVMGIYNGGRNLRKRL